MGKIFQNIDIMFYFTYFFYAYLKIYLRTIIYFEQCYSFNNFFFKYIYTSFNTFMLLSFYFSRIPVQIFDSNTFKI